MVNRDIVEHYKGSTIQHGSYNDRVYLIKLAQESSPAFPVELIELAEKNGYSKVFAKLPECCFRAFMEAGFREEARIPEFYNGKDTAVFAGFYLNSTRAEESDIATLKQILDLALEKESHATAIQPIMGSTVRICDEFDIVALADIYKEVFPSYPFPIHDPDYIKETMNSHIDYFGIEMHGQLVAVSSAEMDMESSNVEMTDFATLPDWRGSGFAQILLTRMEEEMKEKKINTAYTIARAKSTGINITFSKLGYQFGGRLKNNTNISGQIESMNVWHKRIVD